MAYVRKGRGFGQVQSLLLAQPVGVDTTSQSSAIGPNLANPDAGTFSDVNCPWWCWVLGNGIDTAVSSQCFPCGNVCPAGSIWDTTNLTCSATPVTSNTGTPQPQPAGTLPSWVMPLALAGVGLVMIGLFLKK